MGRGVQAKKPQRAPREAGGSNGRRPGRASQGREGSGRPSRGTTLLLLALVLAAAVGPNLSSLRFEFVWDDTVLLGPKLDVKSGADLLRIWETPFDSFLNDRGPARYFRPAVLTSLALDRALWGENPRGYHAQNLVWYALCCVLLWLLAWEISGAPLAATACAVLYALHPTHPESVCFISGRTDLMAGAFLFASLWLAAGYGRRIESAWLKLGPASLALLLGLYSKEVCVFGAPLLPLVLWLRDRRLAAGALLRASVPVVAVVALFFLTRTAVVGPSPVPVISPVQGTANQILTSVAVVARYLPILLLAVGLSARHEIVETHHPDLVFAAGLLVLGAMAVGIVALARRRSIWLLPLALFAVTLLPLCYVRLLSGALVAERFLFVPSAALALAVALLPGTWTGGRSRAARVAGAVEDRSPTPDAGPLFLGVAAAASVWLLLVLVPRVAIWRDEGTLFGSMLRDSPESPAVHVLLGGYYYRERDLERAALHYRRAHQLYPLAEDVLLNLGATEDEMGATDSAFVHIRELNALDPEFAQGWYALGNLFVRIDRPDSARAAYQRALAREPNFPQAENNLGAVLERMGLLDEAMAHYRRAEEIEPGYPDAANNLKRLGAEMAGRKAGQGGAGGGATR
jgi:tetratricopeptide (TPR) repeat protein